MSDVVLWTGALVSAGSIAGIVSRSVKVPAAAGALAGGFALAWAGGGGLAVPGADPLALLRSMLLAYVCFLLGTELDLTRAVRAARSAALGAVASGLSVLALVWGAMALLRIDPTSSLILAAAASGASPAAAIALLSEARARGERAQRILLGAAVGFLFSIVATGAAIGSTRHLIGWAAALGIGLACGLIILMPMSRLSARGAMAACVGAGTLILTGAGSRILESDAGVALASIAAGLVAGNLTSNRDGIRDAVLDLSFPAVVAFFAIMGPALLAIAESRPGGEAAGTLIAGSLLVAAARIAGLVIAGIATRRRDGMPEALALAPIALLGPGLAASAAPADPRVLPILAGGVLVTQIAGMAAARWMMIRAGAIPSEEDPDAWRAAMR
jgi:hypothetical protein